jgi:hypothetical protein
MRAYCRGRRRIAASGLHNFCMDTLGIWMTPSRRARQADRMDVLAVLIALAVFALLVALIFGIERV